MTNARRSLANSLLRAALVLVSLYLGFAEVIVHRHRIRSASDDTDESRRRNVFKRTLVLTDSFAPSPTGPIHIREAWIEGVQRVRLGVLPYLVPGWERLVLRVETESYDVRFYLQGLDWPRDTVVVYRQYYGGPRVRFTSRDHRLPDTLRFIDPGPLSDR